MKEAGYVLHLCPRAGDLYEGWHGRLPKGAIAKRCLNFKALDALPAGMMVEGLARMGGL